MFTAEVRSTTGPPTAAGLLQRQVDALRILCPDWSKISERTTSTASVPWLGKDLRVDFSRVLQGGTPNGLGILEPKAWAATDVYSFILWDSSHRLKGQSS